MQNLFSKFSNDESGATAIEYGLIAALIAVALIAGATAVGERVNEKFDVVAGELKDAPASTASNGIS